MSEINSPAVQPHDGFQCVALPGLSGVAEFPCKVKPCGYGSGISVESPGHDVFVSFRGSRISCLITVPTG
jgi:hypothetical protein